MLKNTMRRTTFFIFCLFFLTSLHGQTLLETVKSHPVLAWGGSDVVVVNDSSFLVGVAAVEAGTKKMSALRRVGMIKAQKEVVTFVNGADITSSEQMSTQETVIDTNGRKTIIVKDEYVEQIREDSEGFVRQMQPLGFWYEEDQSVFYYAIYKHLTR